MKFVDVVQQQLERDLVLHGLPMDPARILGRKIKIIYCRPGSGREEDEEYAELFEPEKLVQFLEKEEESPLAEPFIAYAIVSGIDIDEMECTPRLQIHPFVLRAGGCNHETFDSIELGREGQAELVGEKYNRFPCRITLL